MTVDEENLLPQAPVQVNAEKAPTDNDKNGKVKD
jgi:hypothetical protein